MKRNKVLIIRNSWGFGGAEKYPINLSITLSKNGYQPIVITNLPVLRDKCRSASIKAFRGPWNKSQGWSRKYYVLSPLYTFWYILALIFLQPAVVHPQGRDDFMFATRAARLLRIPVVWTDHGDLKYVMKQDSPLQLRKAIARNARYANAVIAVSESEKQEILNSDPSFPNLVVVYNGVFIPKKVPAVKRPQDKTIIISTSRLIDTKGIRELIKGYAASKNLGESLLWLVGTGEHETEYKAMVKELDLESNVIFWGFQDNVQGFLAAADIFIHPSYHEAFSLSIIEAAMAGKPLVVTNVGGNPEIANTKNGILIQPKDEVSITKALNSLVGNSTLSKKLGKQAAQDAHQKFDFEKIVKQEIIPLYNKDLS